MRFVARLLQGIRRAIPILLLVLSGVGPVLLAQPRTRIVVGADANLPPYEYADAQGRPAGYDVELIQAVGREVGLDVVVRTGPWQEVKGWFDRGEVDALCGMFHLEDRTGRYDFSVSHSTLRYALFTRRGEGSIRGEEDLAGKRILVAKGNLEGERFKGRGLDVVQVASPEEALVGLAQGQGDCAVAGKAVGLYLMRKRGLANLQAVGEPFLPRNLCFAVRKGDSALLAQLNDGLFMVRESGKGAEIYARTFGRYDPPSIPATLYLQIAAWILVPAFVLLSAVLLWSWSLKRTVRQRTLSLRRELKERMRAEEDLRESSERLQTLIDAMPDIVGFKDGEGRWLTANRFALTFLGIDPATYRDRTNRDLASEYPFIRELLETGEAEEEQTWIRGTPSHRERQLRPGPGAEARVFDFVGVPLYHEDGTRKAMLLLGRDITRRKKAEAVLLNERATLDRILDLNPYAILMVDRRGRAVRGNPALRRLLGADPAPDADHLADPALWPDPADLEARLRRGEVVTVPERWYAPAGGGPRVCFRTVAFPLLDPMGGLEHAVFMHEDVTQRVASETALRESEERFRGLYQHTPDCIFWVGVDGEGRFRYEGINPAQEVALGRTNAQVAGHRPEECLPGALAAQVTANYHRCVASGRPITYEEAQELPKGHTVWQTLLVPIRDAGGRIHRIVGTSRDITQGQATEQALRQSQKLESLGVLAGGIAHDFNNLLTAILGNLNLAQLQLSPSSPAVAHLESVERTVIKAADLTKQMLAYSGKGHFVVKAHDLNEVVRELTHLLKVSISKKVSLQFRLATDLPPIMADAAQIQQVVMNLVTNASDAIGEAEGVVFVGTRTMDLDAAYIASTFSTQELEPGAFVVLEVGDTGCGMTPEVMARIFDPFFTTKRSGRGLGLSAMLGILRGHHAGIKIYSEPGRGSSFKVFFPAQSLPPQYPEVKTADLDFPFTGTALVVDDEPMVRESAAAAMSTLGFTVLEAVDGLEAVAIIRDRPEISLVVLDLTMPRMDGREAFEAIRVRRPDLPVILCSGYNEHESIQDLLGQGLAGFLQKPYLLKDLRRKVRDCFRQPVP